MSKPPIEIDWKVIDAILQFNATLKDCAEITGVSPRTIERRIKSDHDMSFGEYKDTKMARARMRLAQKQYDVAMSGNPTLLIWLGKNMLGQTDKQEIDQNTNVSINIDGDDNKL